MTEKRFKITDDGIVDTVRLKQYKKIKSSDNILDSISFTHLIDVVDLLNTLHEENQQLKKTLRIIADAKSVRDENSVKEILRNNLFGLDTVAGESFNAYKEYTLLNNFFKDYYNEYWDNDKYD